MAWTDFKFTPEDGLDNTTTFPSKPTSGAAARAQLMTIFNQIKAFLNGGVKDYVDEHKAESVFEHAYISADISIVTVSVYTLGFKPKSIIIDAAKLNTMLESTGKWAENGTQSVIYKKSDGTITATNNSIVRLEVDANNYLTGGITATDTGFTITWTKTGTPTGYIIFNYLASTH